jgi:hypothetical protein
VGGGERGRVNIVPPQANFKTLVNKNAIKDKTQTPRQFFLKAFFGQKTSVTPSPGFSTRVHL